MSEAKTFEEEFELQQGAVMFKEKYYNKSWGKYIAEHFYKAGRAYGRVEASELVEALEKSIKRYDGMERQAGWHDLEYKRNCKALKNFKDKEQVE